MSEAQGNGARLAADRDALRDKAAFGAPIGTEWRREERANRTATSLDRTDAEGISGRDVMNDALRSVDAYRQARGTGETPPGGMSQEVAHRAREDVSAAWDHPEAAKAMRAAGATRGGMSRDLEAGRLDSVLQGLSAPDPAAASTRQADPDGEVIASGWTRREAEAMDAHIGAKYAREHPEPSEAATRQAERMADPTDRMHDAQRERAADAVQARREGVRQTAADYRAGLMAAAPARLEAPALAETQARRAVQRV